MALEHFNPLQVGSCLEGACRLVDQLSNMGAALEAPGVGLPPDDQILVLSILKWQLHLLNKNRIFCTQPQQSREAFDAWIPGDAIAVIAETQLQLLGSNT